jgi:hypothetical protein
MFVNKAHRCAMKHVACVGCLLFNHERDSGCSQGEDTASALQDASKATVQTAAVKLLVPQPLATLRRKASRHVPWTIRAS